MVKKRKNSDAFGTVLRFYRLEKGLTQEQLSERVDVVRSFICTLESGKKQPSLSMVFRLAAALGVSPGELVDAVAARLAENWQAI
jgi:transcriptional regulator with XRE-family HTH domain